jgi:enoyl-CoA hydratase
MADERMEQREVAIERRGDVAVVTINRPEVRNAIDRPTALVLAAALEAFDADDDLAVGVLTGAGGSFCAGLDLKALGAQIPDRATVFEEDGYSPTGPARLALSKPLIAAVEGYAVVGGFELALFCDLRVAAEDAVFGVFNRRWGIPLQDGGTVRLPRIVGQGRAMDLILTGRPVRAPEAFDIGLVNRLARPGKALAAAVHLAREIARFPRGALLADRRSLLKRWSCDLPEAMRREFRGGMAVIENGEARVGAARFAAGRGRHGSFEQI